MSAAGKLDTETSKITPTETAAMKKKSTLSLISQAIKTSSKIDFEKL